MLRAFAGPLLRTGAPVARRVGLNKGMAWRPMRNVHVASTWGYTARATSCCGVPLRSFCSDSQFQDPEDMVKKIWMETFAKRGEEGKREWEGMSEEEQRAWFERVLVHCAEGDGVQARGLSPFDSFLPESSLSEVLESVEQGYVPNSLSFSPSLIQHLPWFISQAAEDRREIVSRVLSLAEKLETGRVGCPESNERGSLAPSERWCMLLYALADLPDGEEAERALRTVMTLNEKYPEKRLLTGQAFTAVASAFGEQGMIDKAIGLMEMADAKNIPLDEIFFSSVAMDAVGNDDEKSLSTIVQETAKRGRKLPNSVADVVREYLSRRGRSDLISYLDAVPERK